MTEIAASKVPLGTAHSARQAALFQTAHLQADLKGRSIRGGAITLIAQGIKFFLQMASTMVLARLLTPADFGLVNMVTAISGFAAMFKDAGLSMATVQREHITHEQVSTLFWINVALSAALTLILAACAPLIALIYGEPRLVLITIAIAGSFILGGLTVQHQALLQRQMRYKDLARIQVSSMAAGIVAAVAAAAMTRSYWALVVMPVITGLVNAIGAWRASGWRPGPPRRGCGVRPMLRFGGNLMGFNLINYIAANADNVLVGASFGTTAVGLYGKAYNLILLPIRQITAPMTTVAVPGLSRLAREPENYRRYYRKALQSVALLTKPAVMLLLVTAPEAVAVVLGHQWIDAVPIFRILSIVAFVYATNIATGWVYVSSGRTDRQLRWECVSAPIRVIGMAIGLYWGVRGVAYSVAITMGLLYLPARWYCYRNSPVRMTDFFKAIALPTSAAMLSAGVVLGLGAVVHWDQLAPLVSLLVKASVFSAAYAALLLGLPPGRRAILDAISAFPALRNHRWVSRYTTAKPKSASAE